jgi:hypothetical protein
LTRKRAPDEDIVMPSGRRLSEAEVNRAAGVAGFAKQVRTSAHSAPNGTVSVKMHKRRRLTLVVPREELDALLIERVEALEKENRHLRRRVTEVAHAAADMAEMLERLWTRGEVHDAEIDALLSRIRGEAPSPTPDDAIT